MIYIRSSIFTLILLGSYGGGCAIAGALYYFWELSVKVIAIGGAICWGVVALILLTLADLKKLK